MLRRHTSTAERTVTPARQQQQKRLTEEARLENAPVGSRACVDAPVGSRAWARILTSDRQRSCVRPLTRRMTAGPDGVRDPVLNTDAAWRAVAPHRFSGSSVRPIVISLRSFTPAPTRAWAALGDRRAVLARIVRDPVPVRTVFLFSRGRSRGVARRPAARRGRVRRSPAAPARWHPPAGWSARPPAKRRIRPARR